MGPGVIEAFYAGLDVVDLNDYQFVCKLDLDLIMPPRYFELMIERMRIALVWGLVAARHTLKRGNQESYFPKNVVTNRQLELPSFIGSAVLSKLVVLSVRSCGMELIAIRCRLLGWISLSWDEKEVRFVHLRPMGSSQKGILTGRIRHGFGQYYMGTGIAYVLASTLYRLNKKPYITGALAMLWGFISSAVKRVERLG